MRTCGLCLHSDCPTSPTAALSHVRGSRGKGLQLLSLFSSQASPWKGASCQLMVLFPAGAMLGGDLSSANGACPSPVGE